MKTMIAVPCMSLLSAGFARSLALLKKGEDCDVRFEVDSLVYVARNRLSALAVEKKAEYVLWLDSDMIFEPDLLEKLQADIELGKDIVTGLYFSRRYPYFPVLYERTAFENGMPVCRLYNDYPKDRLFPVEACGFGTVLMKTAVLADMEKKYDNWFAPLIGFGEDLSFCIRARECGYEIWCDPTVKPGHVGSITVTEDLFEALRKRKDKTENEK